MPRHRLAYIVGPWSELPEQAKGHWGEYYEEIGKSLRAASFEPFLAYREIATLPPMEIPRKMRNVLRLTKLVVAELTIDSPDADLILGRVVRSRKREIPVIILHHEAASMRLRGRLLAKGIKPFGILKYNELNGGAKRLREFLIAREHYFK